MIAVVRTSGSDGSRSHPNNKRPGNATHGQLKGARGSLLRGELCTRKGINDGGSIVSQTIRPAGSAGVFRSFIVTSARLRCGVAPVFAVQPSIEALIEPRDPLDLSHV